MVHLIIGGILIPLHAAHTLRQTYEQIGGVHRGRMLSGAAYAQQHWGRLRTVITGSGSLPAPLTHLSQATAYEIACIEPRAIGSTSNVITLPSARRSDVAPVGYAVMADGSLVKTTCNIAGNTATLGVVSGAQHYEAWYWPRFSAYLTLDEDRDHREAANAWRLVAEEV